MNKDVVGGLGLLAFSILYLWGAAFIPRSSLSDGVGAQGLPMVLGGILAIVAVFIFARGWVSSTSNSEGREGARLPRIAGLLGCGALYIAAAWLAGYVVATGVTIFAVAVYEGAPANLRTISISACGAAIFWLVFVKVLNVAQPVGLVFGG